LLISCPKGLVFALPHLGQVKLREPYLSSSPVKFKVKELLSRDETDRDPLQL